MSVAGLVLDLFPGIGLLARAFEAEGYCVVSGPDLIFGGDVRDFHPPTGVFEGVIGGPPCQAFSRIRYLQPRAGSGHGNMIPEFERCIREARPDWFLMENVPDAPIPDMFEDGYLIRAYLLDNRWAPEAPAQHRVRRFSFGTPDGQPLHPRFGALENVEWVPAVLANGLYPAAVSGTEYRMGKRMTAGMLPDRRSTRGLAVAIERQGLPAGFLDGAPFTVEGKFSVVGNGVPLPLGRMVADAVRRATGRREERAS